MGAPKQARQINPVPNITHYQKTKVLSHSMVLYNAYTQQERIQITQYYVKAITAQRLRLLQSQTDRA